MAVVPRIDKSSVATTSFPALSLVPARFSLVPNVVGVQFLASLASVHED